MQVTFVSQVFAEPGETCHFLDDRVLTLYDLRYIKNILKLKGECESRG